MLDLTVQQGWQCPVCKRIYSPSVDMCKYCGNKECIASEDSTPSARNPVYDNTVWCYAKDGSVNTDPKYIIPDNTKCVVR